MFTNYTFTRIKELGSLSRNKWGEKAQMVKACEELAELSVQLCKRINGSPTSDEAVIDEIADATIMIFQIREYFDSGKIEERILYKLRRLEAALNR